MVDSLFQPRRNQSNWSYPYRNCCETFLPFHLLPTRRAKVSSGYFEVSWGERPWAVSEQCLSSVWSVARLHLHSFDIAGYCRGWPRQGKPRLSNSATKFASSENLSLRTRLFSPNRPSMGYKFHFIPTPWAHHWIHHTRCEQSCHYHCLGLLTICPGILWNVSASGPLDVQLNRLSKPLFLVIWTDPAQQNGRFSWLEY